MQLEFNFFIFWACKWDIVPLNELTEEAVLNELSSLFHSNMEETIGLHL